MQYIITPNNRLRDMDSLFILQYSCFFLSFLLFIILIVSQLQQNNVNRQYRSSRYCLIVSTVLLAVHYLLQMKFGLRATSDNLGAIFNIIFYTPVAYCIFSSILFIECGKAELRRHMAVGCIVMLAVLSLFVTWWLVSDRFMIPLVQNIMHVAFIIAISYYIFAPVRSIYHNRRKVIDNTGGDIMPYLRYTWSGYLMLCATSVTLFFAIFYRPLLYVVAPFILLGLIFFVLSFVAMGYNLAPIESVFDDVATPPVDNPDEHEVMPSDLTLRIASLLDTWKLEGGYRDPSVNMAKLAQQLQLARRDLSMYFENSIGCTFRVWLSDIRFAAAQELMLQHPDYSNDVVSSCCGFSSRSQLYKIFSVKTGMSPREWREKQTNV